MLDLSRFTILVVDDEPDMLAFLSTVLADNGAAVFRAKDGIEALKIAKEIKPDLVTLDLQMPGMDCGEVFEGIRRDPELSKIPVCIISGKPELRGLIYQRTVRPPEGYLDKPVNEKTILLNVRKILTLQRKGE